MAYIGNEEIDLQLTLIDSAQCFRWVKAGDAFGAVIGDRPVWLWKEGGELHAVGIDPAAARDYLDLNRDYGQLAEACSGYPAAQRAIARYPGLRVLNQPVWDVLVMFILSANNNVSRIRKLCDALAAACGPAFEMPRGALRGLPSPERLASCTEAELRALGMGYRAPYLIGTARAVAGGFPLDALRGMDVEDAHRMLVQLPGVGDKVADCALLFGCRHAEAFPVDVWVRRLMAGWFGIESARRGEVAARARAMFGPEAGLVQQFLFHAARMGAFDAGGSPAQGRAG